jgi:hypothetical protein
MRIISSVLISAAVLDGLVTIGFLLMWLKGTGALVVRNFAIQTPAMIVLFILIQLVIVAVAMVAIRNNVSSNEFTMTNLF